MWPVSVIGTKRTCKPALMNVSFEGNNGHDADDRRSPLMTHNGHSTKGDPGFPWHVWNTLLL